MANTKIKLNISGLRELRNDPGVCAELQKQANAVAERAGEGFVAEQVQHGATRARCKVHADTPHAYYSNMKHNTLLKALK